MNNAQVILSQMEATKMMTTAQYILTQLTAKDVAHVASFMKEYKYVTLEESILWLFEVIDVYGEDMVCPREHDLPILNTREQRLHISQLNVVEIDAALNDLSIPF